MAVSEQARCCLRTELRIERVAYDETSLSLDDISACLEDIDARRHITTPYKAILCKGIVRVWLMYLVCLHTTEKDGCYYR